MLLSAASLSLQGVWIATEVFFDTLAKSILGSAGSWMEELCTAMLVACSLQPLHRPSSWELSFSAQLVLKMGRKTYWICTAVPLLSQSLQRMFSGLKTCSWDEINPHRSNSHSHGELPPLCLQPAAFAIVQSAKESCAKEKNTSISSSEIKGTWP